jgi:hypothetical protein
MMERIRRISPLFLISSLLLMCVTSTVTPMAALAASEPIYKVMNTDSPPPDGVWFRNSPHTSDTDRVTGHGVYAGDQVSLACYAWGDAVGPYDDTLWYEVSNITRPTVPSNGKANTGYLNAHYINDGKAAGQIDAGVPQCGVSAPAPVAAATPTVEYLLPDGFEWCHDNPPFTGQVNDLGWVVTFLNMLNGDTTANNAKCQYAVGVEIPTGTGDKHDDTFGLVIPHYDTNVNWASACTQQYPGSTLKWEYFTPTPWQCVAPAGRYYPPTQ